MKRSAVGNEDMKLEILAVYEGLDEYIAGLERGAAGSEAEALWEEYAIRPYWSTLTRYAPFDMADRKPAPVMDATSLKRQLSLLRAIDLKELQEEFERVAATLPSYDEDPVTVALYPLSDGDRTVKERQNGVVGTSLWGNMTIRINPLADGFYPWIPYVFAHEYHHSIFGGYWYALHGGSLENTLLEALLCDGEADTFALNRYPSLRPQWLFGVDTETEKRLWREYYEKALFETNFDYPKLMFGDEASGIPWCAGYAIGYRIIQQYLKRHPGADRSHLHELNPRKLYADSGYYPS